MLSVGVVGASGYGGAELLRLCAGHPALRVVVATADTQAGTTVAGLYPSLAAAYPDTMLQPADPAVLEGLDVVFLALPHGASQALAPQLVGKVGHLIDLAADFRLKDPAVHAEWYGSPLTAPDLIPSFAYGLPELFRSEIAAATHVAAPGCYPTAAGLALAPLISGGLVETEGLVVDAASGVSGAGRGKFPFCGTDEDFVAYGLLDHRHTPEIEQLLTEVSPRGPVQVLFTPHLAPMNRGILATCYARPAATIDDATVRAAMRDFYADEPFVVVQDGSPSTKATAGANTAHVHARYDERTGWVIALAAIDNLVKGAAGQAVQCANLVLGLDETAGLPTVALYP